MKTENMPELTMAELDEVGGGLPFLAMPAVIGYIDWYQLPPPVE